MLEGVGVDIAFAQCFVWQNIVVEGYQLNVQAIFVFRNFLRDFCYLLFGTNNHADFNVVWIFFILTAAYQCQ
ncbi:Uncharacterised protein [Shigella sonnei]|nr:Uncharacterised protein [Shigella sonnei]GDU57631.1 hypothetical protein BvCmsSIP076_01932 [Escherichia coli]CSG00795.1 Uncharacterised protein [Shigella sonnei]CSG55736.1 Uncharacterised protein [Shigella sonnei]CSG64523.1 Uncharacterised protein [Shigella sonnei]